MNRKIDSKDIIRLCITLLLPGLAFIISLFVPMMAYAGGIVTDCSNETDLRAKLVGGGLVTFDCDPAQATIALSTSDISGSHINITQTTTISGGGLIILEGNGSNRIFNVAGSTLILEGLTISNGRALGSDPNDRGGALRIVNGSVVTITASTLSNNHAEFIGGAIYAGSSDLYLKDTTLKDNQARFGGAIYASKDTVPEARITIINSAIISNTATDGDGGAIRGAEARLTIANSTLSNNRAIEVSGGSVGGDGGALGIVGSGSNLTYITNTTIYSNFASTNGGGIQADSASASGSIKNSIVANNVAASGANCGGDKITSNGHNLSSDTSCNFAQSSDRSNTNPLLGPLSSNGGGTLTHAPLPGSPTINKADNAACAAFPVSNIDQRGVSRPQGTTCDIGAVEATTNLALAKSSINQGGDPVHPGERITYTVFITNTGSLTATGGVISDSLPTNTSFVASSITLEPPSAGLAGSAPPQLASGLTIGANESVTVTYAVLVNSPLPDQTVIKNTAAVTSNEISQAQTSTVQDTVSSSPVLAIQKTSLDVNGGVLKPGDTINYTVVVANNGSAEVTGGVISDSLPTNTSFVASSITLEPPSAGLAGSAPPQLASGLTIGANESVTVTYAVLVNSPLPDQTVIKNTAAVTSNEISQAQTSTVQDTVSSSPVLAIQKTSLDVNGGVLKPGDTINYTVVVANNGSAEVTGGVISDSLPTNTSFVASSITLEPPSAGLAGSAPPQLASGLTIGANESVTVTYAVLVNSPLPDQTVIKNTAAVTSNETPNPITDVTSDVVTSKKTVYFPLLIKN